MKLEKEQGQRKREYRAVRTVGKTSALSQATWEAREDCDQKRDMV